jgi:hypothetical protein
MLGGSERVKTLRVGACPRDPFPDVGVVGMFGLDGVAIGADAPRLVPCVDVGGEPRDAVVLDQPLAGGGHEVLPSAFALLRDAACALSSFLGADALLLTHAARVNDAPLDLPEEVRKAFLQRP